MQWGGSYLRWGGGRSRVLPAKGYCERRRCPGRNDNQSLIRRASITADLEMAWRKRNHEKPGMVNVHIEDAHVNAMIQIKQDYAAPSSPKRCDHDAPRPSSLLLLRAVPVQWGSLASWNGTGGARPRAEGGEKRVQLHHAEGGGNNILTPSHHRRRRRLRLRDRHRGELGVLCMMQRASTRAPIISGLDSTSGSAALWDDFTRHRRGKHQSGGLDVIVSVVGDDAIASGLQ